MKKLLSAVAVFVSVCSAATQTYMPDFSKSYRCWVDGTNGGSPDQIHCKNPHDFAVGQAVTVTNVKGDYVVNGVRFIRSIVDANTVTLKDVDGNPINSSGTWSDGYTSMPYDAGWIMHVVLSDLRDHPRGLLFDGPSGTFTNKMKDTTCSPQGRGCTSGIQWEALDWAYGNGLAHTNDTYVGYGGGGYLAGIIKCFVLGAGCTSGTNYDFARRIPLNPMVWIGYGPNAAGNSSGNPYGLFCNEAGTQCGFGDNISAYPGSGAAAQMAIEAQYATYSLSDLQTAIDFALNDYPENKGGLGMRNNPTVSCVVPPVPVQKTITNITGTSTITVFAVNDFANGDHVVIESAGGMPDLTNTWVVSSVTGTSFVLNGATTSSTYTTGGTATRVSWWDDASNRCGYQWMYKHHDTGLFSNQTYYPDRGGDLVGVGNQDFTAAMGNIAAGITGCGDDVAGLGYSTAVAAVKDRACRLLSMTMAHLTIGILPDYFGSWSMTNANAYYAGGRSSWMVAQTLTMLHNAVVSWPDMSSGLNDDQVYYFMYFMKPYNHNVPAAYGQVSGYSDNTFADGPGGLRGIAANSPLASTTAQGYALGWSSTMYNEPGGTNNPGTSHYFWTYDGLIAAYTDYTWVWYYGFDPATTQLNPTALPLSYNFIPHGSSLCSTFNIPCNYYAFPTSAVVSRTGWDIADTSNDTMVVFYKRGYTGDGHGSDPNMGDLQIYYKSGALSGDGAQTPANGNTYSSPINTNHVQIDGTDANFAYNSSYNFALNYMHVNELATSTSSNAYMYSVVDYAPAFKENLDIVMSQREVFHLKDTGTVRNYVVRHFTAATSAPHSWNEKIHYRAKQDYSATLYSPGFSYSAGNYSLTDTTTGLNLYSKVINPSASSNAIYITNEGTSYTCPGCSEDPTGASGILAVGSSTNGSTLGAVLSTDWLVVDCPGCTASINSIANKVACTAGVGSTGNCIGIEIDDVAKPQVAVTSLQAGALTGFDITTMHLGTGRYVVAHLNAGSYTVTKDGIAVSGSPFLVAADDTTLTFNSAAGHIAGGAAPPAAPSSTVNGNVKAAGKVVIH